MGSKLLALNRQNWLLKKEIPFTGGVHLVQSTADSLPYEDSTFDVVIMGFCLFWVERKYLFRSIAEADRVLKEGGFLVISDFDTKLPYIRDNIHNKDCYTYKIDYAQMFLVNPQYSLAMKQVFSHASMAYTKDIQERVAMQILFKDSIENSYVKA